MSGHTTRQLIMPRDRKQDQKLLKEIRDKYRYYCDAWKDIRDEAREDMRYAPGNNPWPEPDIESRRRYGRPALFSDQIGQFVNQAINQIRQNPRGIKVDPKGYGADAKSAELREDLIRSIETSSKAWRSAYLPGYENALQRSYGFWRVSREYDGKSFNQVLRIKGILNPDSVLYDPDCKEADWSDAEGVFILDPMRKDDFQRKYPRAEKKDFSDDDRSVAKDWIQDDKVLVAEFYRAEYNTRTLLLLSDGSVAFEDELPDDFARDFIVDEREYEDRRIVKYIVNGVEVLEEGEEPKGCKIIPVIACIGKEIYVDSGSGPRRQLISFVRAARDPQMFYNYLLSGEAEEVKRVPKSPYVGYVGQFESDAEAWKNYTDQPYSYLQIDPKTDPSDGSLLPLPQFQQITPNFQGWSIGKDDAIRAIQAALGLTPLPTAAARRNEKSGVALDKIQEQESVGSFHFVDNLNRALELTGRVLDERLGPVYDAEREIALHKADNSRKIVRLNVPYTDPESQEQQHFPVDQGEHDVTISTAPSYQSQRDAATAFLELLISNIQQLPLAPEVKARLLSLAVQMKQLGPLGDEMAEIISPDQNAQLPPQAMAAIQQIQQKAVALNAYAQELEKELQQLKLEKAGKAWDNSVRVQIDHMEQAVKVLVAEITTKAQKESERDALFHKMWEIMTGQAHEAAMQAADHQHEREMAEANAAIQREQQMEQEAAQSSQ